MNAKLGIFCAVLLSVAGGAPTATSADDPVLDKNQCRIIEEFDDLHGSGAFVDRFIHMAHKAEFCGQKKAACNIRIHKWMREFKLSGKSFAGLDHPNVEIYFENAKYYSDYFYNNTNIRPILTPKFGVDEPGVVVIMYRDSDYDRLLSLFPGSKAQLEVLGSVKRKCIASSYPIAGSFEIHRVIIYIGLDQDEITFANCVKEELINSSGLLNDPVGMRALFDDGYLREKLPPPLYYSYSKLEAVQLSILYSDLIQPGFEEEKTRKVVSELIDKNCHG